MYWRLRKTVYFKEDNMEKKKEAMFKIHSKFKPSGDQPQAIKNLLMESIMERSTKFY